MTHARFIGTGTPLIRALEIETDEDEYKGPSGPGFAFRDMAVIFLWTLLRIRDGKTGSQLQEMSDSEKETVERILDRDRIAISHEDVSDLSLGQIMGIVKRLSVEFTAFCEVVGQPDKGKCLPVDLSVNHRDMGRRRSNRRWGSIIEHVDGKSSGHGRMFDVDDA